MTSHETLATPEMAYVMASFINIQAVYCQPNTELTKTIARSLTKMK